MILATIVLAFNNLNAQTKFKFGSYKGSIEVSDMLIKVVTKLELTNNNIQGNYVYEGASGKLNNCKLESHTLSCNWKESDDLKGNFRAIFNDDYSSFIAIWSYADGTNGGSWFGTRK